MRTPVAVLCLLLGACAEPQVADIAIRGATVVDVASGSLIPDQTILITGNRIVAVGRTDELRVAPETDLVHADDILADTISMRLVPESVRLDWEERVAREMFREFQWILRPIVPLELENVRLLNEAGVTLLAATDVGVALQVPGISLHRQLVRLTEAGLTPLDALQTATLNPARVLGLEDSLGTIEADKLADLVLLDANPLEDISNTQQIRAVVADGRLYRRADLDRIVAEMQALNQRAEHREQGAA